MYREAIFCIQLRADTNKTFFSQRETAVRKDVRCKQRGTDFGYAVVIIASTWRQRGFTAITITTLWQFFFIWFRRKKKPCITHRLITHEVRLTVASSINFTATQKKL